MEETIEALKEEEKQESYHNGHRPRRRSRDGNWFGVLLIGIGAFLLLRNFLDWDFDNWWALFILWPAAAAFNQARRSYARHGRLTHAARGNVIGGMLMTTVALIFLLSLSWGTVWPVFLIIFGVGALIEARCG